MEAQAYSIINQFGDGDMLYDEILQLLVSNEIPLEVAEKVADDIRPRPLPRHERPPTRREQYRVPGQTPEQAYSRGIDMDPFD